jgi:hypothetical protein
MKNQKNRNTAWSCCALNPLNHFKRFVGFFLLNPLIPFFTGLSDESNASNRLEWLYAESASSGLSDVI